MIQALLFILSATGIYFLLKNYFKSKSIILPLTSKTEIEKILNEEIDFYKSIEDPLKKEIFKNRVIHFIETTKITSVGNATHTLSDEVLIASSAIIPIFNFPNWEYNNISEVLLYEDNFDHDFEVDNEHNILGMVGEGAMNNTMILSLKALREGFEKRDGEHTSIHEFIHLIDKADGVIDGVPEYLISKNMIAPWVRMIRNKMKEINTENTDINPYAATNEAEFFAVISEYFFEKPQLLERNHPALFAMLGKIFDPK